MKAESAKKANNQRSDRRVSNLEARKKKVAQHLNNKKERYKRRLTLAVQKVAQVSMMQNLLGQGMAQQQGNYDPHRKASLDRR